jgi:hypothetical protein
MTLTEYLRQYDIEGMDVGLLEALLRKGLSGKLSSDAFISPMTNFLMVRNGDKISADKRIIECVTKYYTNDKSGKALKLPPLSDRVKCCQVHRAFGITDCTPTHCIECHLACIALDREGKIKRLKVKGRKRQ